MNDFRRPTSIVLPALISGFAAYIPIPGLRGALFAMFPGIAFRDFRLTLKGCVYGFMTDILFLVGWRMLGFVWEPRAAYNWLITHFLPPGHVIITHCSCPVSEAVQFVAGLSFWCVTFFALWLLLWPTRLPLYAYLAIPILGMIMASEIANALFYYAPMNEWGFRGDPEPHTLGDGPLFAFVFSVMPFCSAVVGIMFALVDQCPSFLRRCATEQTDAPKRRSGAV